MKCSECGKENPAGQTYCGNCGALLAVSESPEEPYYSSTLLGITTTVTREGYWVYYGGFLAAFAFFIVLVFVVYAMSGEADLLGLGAGMIVALIVLFWVVVDRARKYRKKRKGD